MRALWLVKQLWSIVPVNSWKNRASPELLHKSNRPQVSLFYRHDKPLGMLEEHLTNWWITCLQLVIYEFFSCYTNIPRSLLADKP